MTPLVPSSIPDLCADDTNMVKQHSSSFQDRASKLVSQEAHALQYLKKGEFYLNELSSFCGRFINIETRPLKIYLCATEDGSGPVRYNYRDKNIVIDISTSPQAFPALLGHEFCHFLQYEYLPYGFMHSPDSEKKYSTEAQADYLSGGYVKYLHGQGKISIEQYREIIDVVYMAGDDRGFGYSSQGVHGSSDERLYYFLKGYSDFDEDFFRDLGNFIRSESLTLPSVAGQIMSNIRSS